MHHTPIFMSLLMAHAMAQPATLADAPPRYALINIPTLDGGETPVTIPLGLSRNAEATGYSNSPGALRGFLWSREDGMLELGTLPGGLQSWSFGVNDDPSCVGDATTSGLFALPRAFLWSGGAMQDLGTLGGNTSTAFAVNNAGHVVGMAQLPDAQRRAFVWRDGVMENLGVLPGGTESRAHDINEKGWIVGWSFMQVDVDGEIITRQLAALWRDDQIQSLGALVDPGGSSRAFGINDLGQIVGSGGVGGGAFGEFPILWEDQSIALLPTFGGAFNRAIAINNRSEIVGYAMDPVVSFQAALWRDGALYNLNDLIPPDSGVVLWQAVDINDMGFILAEAGAFPPGDSKAYLLVPISCRGDINADGVVDGKDLAFLLSQWGNCNPRALVCPADLDGDGRVDGRDLATLLVNWGECE